MCRGRPVCARTHMCTTLVTVHPTLLTKGHARDHGDQLYGHT